ncbi:Rossmann-fold NAD(P)-binding domain-containing protein [Streptomyces coeruleorubidus]|uniref:hypothetical protein n=1 Tax=Streptomyces coeruleorubidus TaxID=116188 RepID=UPI00367504B5
MTLVEPAAFRTDWSGPSMRQSAAVIEDYAATAGARRAATPVTYGHQPGDPPRAAAAVIDAVESSEPPLRLLLGKAAYGIATARLDTLRAGFGAWRDVTTGADYPDRGSGGRRGGPERAKGAPASGEPPPHRR